MKYISSLIFILHLMGFGNDADLGVIGVIHSTIPDRSIVMMRIGEKVYPVKIGIFFANRYRVREIKPRYIVLESCEGVRELRIGHNSTQEDYVVVRQTDYLELFTLPEPDPLNDIYLPLSLHLIQRPPIFTLFDQITPEYNDEEHNDILGLSLTGNLFNILGLERDDILTEYNGTPISSYNHVSDLVNNLSEKKELEVEYIRNGRLRYLRLRLEGSL